MPIQSLAREEVVTANEDASITELARLMRDETVGSVVITNDGSPVGIVTDRDLTTRVLADEREPIGLTAQDVMSSDLCTVGPDAGFYEAAQVMSDNGIRRLPISSEDDELLGIITADDLQELLADEHQQFAAVIRAQRPEY
ncbi:MAG: CBS domain-containing protein [Halobacteriales archaeon]|nr:CBS domain-containing protein [Halobacteriales archaeon]